MVAQGSQTTAVHVPDEGEVVVEHLELDDQPTGFQLHNLKPQEAVDAGIGTVAQEVVNELRVEDLKVGCGHGEASKNAAGNSPSGGRGAAPSGRCVRYAPSGGQDMTVMRTAIQLTAEGGAWPDLVTYVTEAERLGVDHCWVAEAWGGDAATPIAALAQHTDRMTFGSGVFQVGARSAANTAMTALTLQRITDGRFSLGLGASGPQVIEGLHGVPFGRPLTRMRETIEVVRMAEAGEKLILDGAQVRLPLPGGEGKALRLSLLPGDIPLAVYIASLSPRMLALTGEVADGWLGTSFVPEGAQSSMDALAEGAARSGRTLADLDLCQGAEVAFARDDDDLAEMVAARKPGLAFSLGGMGSADTNFYNAAYARQGFAKEAAESQALWLAGRRDAAAASIPDAMVLATTLIGNESQVADRLALWRDVGISHIRLYPAGDTLDERLATLGRALDLIRGLGSSQPADGP